MVWQYVVASVGVGVLTYIDALSALSIYLPIVAAYSYPVESKLLMLVAVTPFSH
jgi:hypothetical protein